MPFNDDEFDVWDKTAVVFVLLCVVGAFAAAAVFVWWALGVIGG